MKKSWVDEGERRYILNDNSKQMCSILRVEGKGREVDENVVQNVFGEFEIRGTSKMNIN